MQNCIKFTWLNFSRFWYSCEHSGKWMHAEKTWYTVYGFWHGFVFFFSAFLSFEIGIQCLIHECFILGWCVTCIYNLYDLDLSPRYQNYIFFMNLCLGKIVFALWWEIPNLAHVFITMRQYVVYIHDLCMTLTFDLYVGSGGILSDFYSQFLSC